jgi:hypothetical protein
VREEEDREEAEERFVRTHRKRVDRMIRRGEDEEEFNEGG